MTKKFLRLIALAAFAVSVPAAATAQRVGPVEDEPVGAASGGGPARVEKKGDAARPGDKAAAKAGDEKAAAKPAAADDKAAPEAAGKPAANVGDAKAATPQPLPANGEAAHAAQGVRAASQAGDAAKTAVTQPGPAMLPAAGSPSIGTLPAPPKYETPEPIKADIPAAANAPVASVTAPNAAEPPPTSIYRLGSGDILDIRLTGGMSREPTLFTVLSNGAIDYPLAGEPTLAAGLTPEEIAARLSAAIKRRGIYDRAQFQITVREYASHTVLVSGLVDRPGQKVLRREAVPLYVVLAESFTRSDAGRVVISRATGQTKSLDLSDSNALGELVASGDVINVLPRPREFFYIGGQIGAGGQKDFNPGMTLMQTILASGGVTRDAGAKVRVAVARQGADGRLVTTEYDLREIEAGRVPDPRVQPGDRIEVGRRR